MVVSLDRPPVNICANIMIEGICDVGASLHPLARAVAMEGGIGVISSVCLGRLASSKTDRNLTTDEAIDNEVGLAKSAGAMQALT